MPNKLTETPVIKTTKSSVKISLFFIAIAVLIATNLYYVFEYKNLGNKVELLSSEKHMLQAEVDRIEAELDRLIQDNPTISKALMENQIEARSQITNLRYRLTSGDVSDSDIEIVRFEVQNLRYLVDEYNVSIDKLKKENIKLSKERDKLQVTVKSANEQVDQLTEENILLQEKVETASGLKISEITLNGIQLRSRDRERIETRAKRVNFIRINFDIVDNPLAVKGTHDVFIRVMDPNGNLLTYDDGTFNANDKTMQYTDKMVIDFSNDGKKYSIDWQPKDEQNFQKGIYTMVLYTHGYTMGRASITLK